MKQKVYVFVMVTAVVEVETPVEYVEAPVVAVEPASSNGAAPVSSEIPPTVRCPVAPATRRDLFGIRRGEKVRRGR